MADILLVDNDARLTELLAWFLKKRGHVVRTAVSYEEARARIGERKPELMLADLELGRERGRDEMERMDRDGSLPLTLVVSGYLDRETELRLANVRGIVGTLRKPFELDKLEHAIAASIGSTVRRGAAESVPDRRPVSNDARAASGRGDS